MNRIVLALALCAALFTTTASAGNMGIHGAANTALPNSGKVLEVINVAGYTYLHIEGKDKKEWIAGRATEVKAGDTVRYSKGSIMRNFTSKTLNRTFPEILFTSAIQLETPSDAAAAATEAGSGKPLGVITSRVISTMDSGGYTYIEVDQDGKNIWLAAPKTTLKKGDTIRYADDGAVMKNFLSKSLNRTFPEITFIGEAQVVE